MNIAKYLILGTCVIWVIVDLWLDKTGNTTISQEVMAWTGAIGVPLIFGMGYLSSHFTWAQKR